ncbi:hypothetical protein HK099_004162 [Clydaea vesicula]|uniref:Uncharacterized protein n=1 Tax=Clydaea vesicula TaxID=447962 RepID=A0AAD5Y0F2_9FUNG|nr:hypothetical protein HK099_004162 [Clydaea vesicula]KAJ3386944.1 hypothetical protein HDU92_002193 [Lobulomyces angularis]
MSLQADNKVLPFNPIFSETERILDFNKVNLTTATITVRLIKSFEFRTVKNIILKDLNLNTLTLKGLKTLIFEKIKTTSGLKPYLNVNFDTLKIYTKAHGSKTQNLVINFEEDSKLYLKSENDDCNLIDLMIENETELSFFTLSDYEKYKLNPETKW